MKKRKCQITIGFICPVAWGSVGTEGLKSCYDEPMEENCKYLVDEEPEVECCPTCGTALGIKQEGK